MKRSLSLVTSVFAAVLVTSTGLAQQSERPPVGPVEIYACNYVDGNDLADFMAVAGRWNRWADGHGFNDYTALVMTPFFYSDQMTADVLWLGAWPTGQSMGAGLASWLSDGGDMAAAFEEVVDCATHMSLASINIRPPIGDPSDDGLVMFQDCSLQEGRIPTDAFAALGEWTDFVADNGVEGPTWVLFPMAGERDDADYDFKIATGIDSPQTFGAGTELYIAGGGVQRANQIMGRVMDCDSPRVYSMTPVRLPSD